MKYEVKKPFWHRNRPVSVGDKIDLDPDGARWLIGQGKVVPAESGAEEQSADAGGKNRRRGRKAAAGEETIEPVAPAVNEGDEQ